MSQQTAAELSAQRLAELVEFGEAYEEPGEDTPEHPNSSYHNMLRTGFVLAYQRPNYIAQEG